MTRVKENPLFKDGRTVHPPEDRTKMGYNKPLSEAEKTVLANTAFKVIGFRDIEPPKAQKRGY